MVKHEAPQSKAQLRCEKGTTIEAKPLILIVDDELPHLRLTEIMLVKTGCMIMTAQDPREALEVLSNCTPDLVLMDVQMPGMTGLELSNRIRKIERLRELPIILLTSHLTEEVTRTATEHGIENVLQKPVDMANLQALVGRTVQGDGSRLATA